MYKKIISVMSVALVVFLCFNFPAYAATPSLVGAQYNYGRSMSIVQDNNGNDLIYSYIRITSMYNEIEDVTYNSNTGRYYYTEKSKVLVSFVVANDNPQDVKLTGDNPNFFILHITPSSVYTPLSYNTNIEYLGGTLYPLLIRTDGYIQLETFDLNGDGLISPVVIPADSHIYCNFVITYSYVNDSANMPAPGNAPQFSDSTVFLTPYRTYGASFGNYHMNYQSYLPDIHYEISSIDDHFEMFLNAYMSNVPASQDVTSDASSASSTIGTQHQQESNIYNQTNQAIGSTGIQNFQFDSQTIGGLGGVKNDFMAVWNSLGTFNSVFITSLTIGLALSIVRHRRMFKQ